MNEFRVNINEEFVIPIGELRSMNVDLPELEIALNEANNGNCQCEAVAFYRDFSIIEHTVSPAICGLFKQGKEDHSWFKEQRYAIDFGDYTLMCTDPSTSHTTNALDLSEALDFIVRYETDKVIASLKARLFEPDPKARESEPQRISEAQFNEELENLEDYA